LRLLKQKVIKQSKKPILAALPEQIKKKRCISALKTYNHNLILRRQT